MSVLDQLRALEQQVQQRLRELRPLVAEYRDLEKVAQRLGLKRAESEPAESPSATPAARSKSKPKPSRARAPKPAAAKRGAAKPTATAKRSTPAATARSKPAATRRRAAKRTPSARRRTAVAPGQRERDVLRLVRERPGITVAELAGELGVDATGLYGVVRRLQSKGQIGKDGTRLQPVDDTKPTTDASEKPSAESGSASSPATAQPRAQGAETPATET
jgi:transposase-like protein